MPLLLASLLTPEAVTLPLLRLAARAGRPRALPRAALPLPYDAAALRLGRDPLEVWRWYVGLRVPSPRNARALARANGVSLEELYDALAAAREELRLL